jgi:hypothetical protein
MKVLLIWFKLSTAFNLREIYFCHEWASSRTEEAFEAGVDQNSKKLDKLMS